MKKKIIIIASVVLIFIVASLTVLSGLKKSLNTASYEMSDSLLARSGSGVQSANPLGTSVNSPVSKSSSMTEMPSAQDAISYTEQTTDKKIIKTGNLGLKVSSVDDCAKSIADIAKANNGDVFSSNIRQSSSKIKSGIIAVKVPVDKFENTISEIKKVAVLVLNESTSGSDVTEQYVDLQAQIKNKKAEEASFVKILESAQKIDDVLAITRELSRTRGEIERVEGRIRYMDSQTDMSTITATLSEDPEITFTDTWRPFQVMKDTINGLLKDFQKFITFLIVLIIRVVPVFILYGIIVFVAYKIGEKIYKKIKSKKEETEIK
ncbi:MAG: DUF4349 domain-containing protein [Parcubacteria group bacterium]|jgi:hypothetical protein